MPSDSAYSITNKLLEVDSLEEAETEAQAKENASSQLKSIEDHNKIKSDLNMVDQRSLSEKIWGIDWDEECKEPLLSDEKGLISIEMKSFDEIQFFIENHFKIIYETDEFLFSHPESLKFKENYYKHTGDFFLIKCDGEVAGLAVCALLDWSVYNLRNIAILPQFQSRGINPLYMNFLIRVLRKHDVARLEGDVCPTNRHHLHILNKIGFVVTGQWLSPEFGFMLHVSFFLDEKHLDQYGVRNCPTYPSDKIHNIAFRGRKSK